MTAKRRKAFQPTAGESLEGRVVLSHVSHPAHAGSSVLPLVAAQPHAQARPRAPLPTVGTLGDSYTDEYRFYRPDRSRARNWVEILANFKGASFGPFTSASRGEPRNQGFAFNWARSDATSSDMIRNQLPGLTGQVASGQVQYAWIFVGGNDFLFLLRDVLEGSISPADAPAAATAVAAQAETNFTHAVDTLLSANPNVRLVVATVPAVGVLPIVQLASATPQLQAVVAATDQAIGAYNTVIRSTAAGNPRIALVDLATSTAQVTESPATGSFPFGGATISLTTAGDDFHDFFLADGIHVGTVGQGIIADAFATAVDSQFGAKIAPPSARQIVQFARRVQTTSRTGGGPP